MKPWPIFILLFLPFLANAQDTLSLEEAMKKAVEANHRIRVAEGQRRMAENSEHIGNAGLLPRLELRSGGDFSKENTTQEFAGNIPDSEISGAETRNANASINLDYTLFDGFGRLNEYKKLKAQRELEKQRARKTKLDILMNVVKSYYELARSQGQYRIAKENVALSQERLERVKNRHEYGKADKVEILNAQVDLDADSSTYMEAELARQRAARNLNVLMGQDPKKDIAAERGTEIRRDLKKDALMDSALERNAQVAEARKNVDVAEFDRKIASAGNYPDLSLNGSYSYSRSESDAGILNLNESDGFNAGISLSFPIFTGFQQNIQEQNAEVRIESNEEQLALVEKEVRRDFLNAWETYRMRLKMLRMEERSLENAQKNFERSQESYQMGRINATQFREAQVNLIKARIRKLNTQYEAKTAEKELLKVSGVLGVE